MEIGRQITREREEDNLGGKKDTQIEEKEDR
jgi:hypothetical protein